MNVGVRIGLAVLAVAGVVGIGAVVGGKIMSGEMAYAAASLEIGQPLPDFALKDTSGKEHKLADYAGKIVVLNFVSQECPFSRGADPAINALATKYADKGVVFLGVDSHKDTTPEAIAKHIESAKVPYPILKDGDNAYADAVGAKVTPELFIAGKDGKLAYHGAPDNRTSPDGEASEHYADAALAALVEGKAVETPEVKAWGCSIKRGVQR